MQGVGSETNDLNTDYNNVGYYNENGYYVFENAYINAEMPTIYANKKKAIGNIEPEESAIIYDFFYFRNDSLVPGFVMAVIEKESSISYYKDNGDEQAALAYTISKLKIKTLIEDPEATLKDGDEVVVLEDYAVIPDEQNTIFRSRTSGHTGGFYPGLIEFGKEYIIILWKADSGTVYCCDYGKTHTEIPQFDSEWYTPTGDIYPISEEFHEDYLNNSIVALTDTLIYPTLKEEGGGLSKDIGWMNEWNKCYIDIYDKIISTMG